MNLPCQSLLPVPARQRLLYMFAESVRCAGDRTAIVAADRRLTYQELDRASDVLSARLVDLGISDGALVGVMMERTVHAAIAYLAILKAGAAFMPLGPDVPVKRNHLILHKSRSSLILTTQATLVSSAAEGDYGRMAQLIDVETLEELGRPCAIASNAVSTGTAYVIHTSGSTGEPKGAANTFEGLLNLVEGLAMEIYPRDPRPKNVALVAPFTFDPSIQQLFGALLTGNCLHICPELARFDGGALLSFLNNARIDIADGTPTHLRLLASAPSSGGDTLSASLLLIGGEALTIEILSAFWRRFGGPEKTAIVNLYGTAECAVDSIFYRVDPAEIEQLRFVPIGRPLPNVDVRVVGPTGDDLPEGEVGELVIGGRGVGVGYVDNPASANERFFEVPERGRFYRTGDLASSHVGGLFRCLGRQDRQIKIRGVRIEPAEIEFAMREFRSDIADGDERVERCTRCLLDARHPGVTVSGGVCSVCSRFEVESQYTTRYFGCEADLVRLMDRARSQKRGVEDCLLLYSGGKDSSYVLLRLIELGYRVATFTFDNGYISRTALENIDRSTKQYGVRHVTANLAQMKQVFAESLRYESTVCGGCFRALTLLSTELARRDGINVVITGLSRGQIFETKLKRLFEEGVFHPAELDRRLQTHRQVFNVREDPISRAVGLNRADAPADDGIQYVDFFRYDAASSADVRRYLVSRDERWRAPKDTGFCSTNCRINDVGIHVHRLEKGYHNYAAPLSWEVRLGVASRADAARELGEPLGGDGVQSILEELRYTPKDRSRGLIQAAVAVLRGGPAGQPMLCGYFVSSGRVNVAELRDHLGKRLPENMRPKHLIRVDDLPLNRNGKVDVARLPLPTIAEPLPSSDGSELETTLKQIWREVLGVGGIEPDDNFFDLGGDSLLATILVSMVESQLGKKTSVVEALHHPTLRYMAEFLSSLPATPNPMSGVGAA